MPPASSRALQAPRSGPDPPSPTPERTCPWCSITHLANPSHLHVNTRLLLAESLCPASLKDFMAKKQLEDKSNSDFYLVCFIIPAPECPIESESAFLYLLILSCTPWIPHCICIYLYNTYTVRWSCIPAPFLSPLPSGHSSSRYSTDAAKQDLLNRVALELSYL